MKEQFVTYKIALKLKELDFDKECLAWFDENKEIRIAPDVYKKWTSKPLTNLNIIKVFNIDCITAPLYQQVTDWFREKHNIHISIPNYYDGWSIDIRGFKQNINLEYHSEPGICLEDYYTTREQAILKVIELCQKEK